MIPQSVLRLYFFQVGIYYKHIITKNNVFISYFNDKCEVGYNVHILWDYGSIHKLK